METHDQSQIGAISSEVGEILARPPKRILRWGSSILLVIVLTVIVIAAFVEYPDVIEGTVKIETTPHTIALNVISGGEITSVEAEDGCVVKKGQDLIVLKNELSSEEVNNLEQLISHVLQYISVGSSIDSLATHVQISATYGPAQNEAMALVQNYESLIHLRNKRDRAIDERSSAIKINQAIRNSDILSEELKLAKKVEDIDRRNLKRAKKLFDSGAMSESDFLNYEISHVRSEQQYLAAKKSLIQNDSQLRELRNAKAQKALLDSIELSEKISYVVKSSNDLQNRINEWKNNKIIQAPIDGELVMTSNYKPHDKLASNELIGVVRPLDVQYHGIGEIQIAGAGLVEPGQKVLIELYQYPSNKYGKVKGIVERCSRVSTDRSDGTFYVVEVSLPFGTKTTYGMNIDIALDLQGKMEVITKSQSVLVRVFNELLDK